MKDKAMDRMNSAVRTEKHRRKMAKSGLKRVEVWVPEEEVDRVKSLAATLRRLPSNRARTQGRTAT